MLICLAWMRRRGKVRMWFHFYFFYKPKLRPGPGSYLVLQLLFRNLNGVLLESVSVPLVVEPL